MKARVLVAFVALFGAGCSDASLRVFGDPVEEERAGATARDAGARGGAAADAATDAPGGSAASAACDGGAPEREPNDDEGHAQRVAAGGLVCAEAAPGDVDHFAFDGAPVRVELDVAPGADTLALEVVVEGQPFASGRSAGGLSVTALPPGARDVRVRIVGEGPGRAAYRLHAVP